MSEVETQDSQFSRNKFWIFNAWIGLAVVYALVTAFSYQGLYRFLAEVQFSWIDRYFPLATVIIIAGVLSLPLFLIFWLRKKLKSEEKATESAGVAKEAEALWQRWVVFMWLAGLCAVALFVQLLAIISIPSATGEVAEYTASDITSAFESGADIDGPARLTQGAIRTDIASFLEDGILFSFLERKFAPVQVAALPDSAAITLFLEVKTQEGAPAPFEVVSEGVLQRKAIPPEIRSLYRDNGLNVSNDAFVLYGDTSSMWIRPLLYGGAALILLILFGMLARSAKRTRAKLLSST